MKWKQITKWCWLQSRFSLMILFIVLAVVYLCELLLRISDNVGVHFNGDEMAIFITLFIIGIVRFAETLRFGLVNGGSRRTVFLGLAAHMVVLGVVSAAGKALIYLIDNLKPASPGYSSSLFELTYGTYLSGCSGAAKWAALLVWIFSGVLCFTAFGLFVGAVFYRLGRVGRVLWAAGLPVGIWVLLPTVISLLPSGAQNSFLQACLSLGGFLQVSPYRLSLAFLAAAVGFMGVNWLLIRRAPLK